jgi:Rrf2 family protein
MRISAQEEYGLRCLLEIAREPGGFLTIAEIARRESLTAPHVAKLMRLLRRAGLVESTRGQKGGYRLARPPEEIRVDAVLAALGGRLYSQEFCDDHAGNGRTCVHNDDCAIRFLWIGIERAVQGVLGATTLKDMLEPRSREGLLQVAKLG